MGFMAERSMTICGETVSGSAHICAFFDSRSEEHDVVIPYYREGLDRGERVVGIVDDGRRDAHLRGLRAGGVQVDAALQSGQLDVLSPGQTYLKHGSFDPDETFAMVLDMLSSARNEGRTVRTCGSMDSLSRRSVPSDKVLEYESRVNVLTRDYDCTLMCVYDLSQINGRLMADIISTHPYVIMNQRLRTNAHYIEPEVYIDEVLRPRITEKMRTGELPPA
jgi:hypothetical protein